MALTPRPWIRRWFNPATIIAIVSAVISLGGAIASWYNANAGNEIQRRAVENQKTVAQTQALTALAQQSEALQTKIESGGIGNVRDLTNFFYLLGEDQRQGMIPADFYKLQIQKWCPLTRQAHAKLSVNWQDAGFRNTYASSPWFLTMLNKLAGQTEKDSSGCL